MSRLRDRVVKTAGTSGELTLYQLDRATEMVCARCAGHSTTKWIAVLGGNWTSLWCKSCFLAMPMPISLDGAGSGTPPLHR